MDKVVLLIELGDRVGRFGAVVQWLVFVDFGKMGRWGFANHGGLV